MFRVFKKEVNKAISTVASGKRRTTIDLYQLCSIIRTAYHNYFTRTKVISSFVRARVWPVDETKLMSKPRPRDSVREPTSVGVPELRQMLLDAQATTRRAIVGEEPVVTRRGFLDKTRGLVLTTEPALAAVRQKAQEYHDKKAKAAERERLRREKSARQARRIAASRAQNALIPRVVRPMHVWKKISTKYTLSFLAEFSRNWRFWCLLFTATVCCPSCSFIRQIFPRM